MSSICLSFVCGSGLSSRLIAWYGNGYGGFSHVDAVLSDGSLLGARSDRIGDIPPGVQIRPSEYESWRRRDVVEIPCSLIQATEWELWLRKQVGKPYDVGAIWGFILGTKDHQAGHWICSAYQTGALKSVGLIHQVPVVDSQITPNSLLLIATAGLGGKVISSYG